MDRLGGRGVTLWTHQERGLALIRAASVSHGRVLVVSPTGCHRIGQELLMFDGSIVKVEKVVVGDRLMGPDSRPRTVQSLCRGRQWMARVVPIKGEPFVVNLDHTLTLARTNDGEDHGDEGSLVDVSVREWIGWNKWNKHIHKLVRTSVEFEPTPNKLPLDPYFLGVLLGDGCLLSTVSVSKGDPEIFAECRRQADVFGLKVTTVGGGGKKSCPTHYLSGGQSGGKKNPIAAILENLGLRGTRSGDKFVPFVYKTSTRDERLAVLAGLLDTDGSASGSVFDFISQSEQLSRDVVFLSQSLGLAAYTHACEKRDQNGGGGTYWRVCISGNTHVIPTRLPRKQMANVAKRKSALRTGFRIELLTTDESFYGFTLDSDGRYLLNDFTITHNSGKSRCAGEVCAGAVRLDSTAIFICHVTELVDQAVKEFRNEFGLRVGIIQADRPTDPDAPIQVASIATLARRDISRYDIVAFDEVHLHVGTATAERVIAANQDSDILGFSASPWRLDGQPMGSLFRAIVPLASYSELIDTRILVPSRVFGPSHPDLSKVHTRDGEFDPGETEEAINTPQLVGDVASTYTRLAYTSSGHRSAILFAHSAAHSEACRDALRAQGHRAESLDYKTPKSTRKEMIEALRAGEIDVLCNQNILTAGFDMRSLGCVIDAAPTQSLARYMQRIGRGMRASPETGKTDLLVLDHSGNVFRHGFAHADRTWTLEAAQKPSPKESIPSLRTCSACFAIFPPVPVCPECGFVFQVQAREIPQRDGILREVTKAPTRDERQASFDELCQLAIRLRRGRGFVKSQYEERFGVQPRFDWPAALPENLAKKRAGLERVAETRGYPKSWVDYQMQKGSAR